MKLTPSPAQTAALTETSRLFTVAFNRFVALGWDAGVSYATKLHYLAYYPVRSELPELNSNLINTARAKAAAAIKSAFALQKLERKVSMPLSSRNNRRSRGRFVCRKCGYELHADLNAARNIAAKRRSILRLYHTSVAIRDAGGLIVNQPIVSSPTRSG